MKVKAINYSYVKQVQSKTNKLRMTQTAQKPYIKKKPYERNIEIGKFELENDLEKRAAEFLKQEQHEEKPMVLMPSLEYQVLPMLLRIPHKDKITVII